MRKFLIFVVGFACAFLFFKKDVVFSWIRDVNIDFGSGAEFSKQIDTLSDKKLTNEEELALADKWENGGKRLCLTRLQVLRRVLNERSDCPAYKFKSSVRDDAVRCVDNLEEAVGKDDYIHAFEIRSIAEDAVRRFENSCYWKSGVSKGPGTHMLSGTREGTWEPERGYVMVGGRPMREFRCNHCGGQGSCIVRRHCSACNGQGRVDNPAAQISDIGNMVGGILGAGKRGRGFSVPNVPREMRCSGCNGSGTVSVHENCSWCGGRGKTYSE